MRGSLFVLCVLSGSVASVPFQVSMWDVSFPKLPHPTTVFHRNSTELRFTCNEVPDECVSVVVNNGSETMEQTTTNERNQGKAQVQFQPDKDMPLTLSCQCSKNTSTGQGGAVGRSSRLKIAESFCMDGECQIACEGEQGNRFCLKKPGAEAACNRTGLGACPTVDGGATLLSVFCNGSREPPTTLCETEMPLFGIDALLSQGASSCPGLDQWISGSGDTVVVNGTRNLTLPPTTDNWNCSIWSRDGRHQLDIGHSDVVHLDTRNWKAWEYKVLCTHETDSGKLFWHQRLVSSTIVRSGETCLGPRWMEQGTCQHINEKLPQSAFVCEGLVKEFFLGPNDLPPQLSSTTIVSEVSATTEKKKNREGISLVVLAVLTVILLLILLATISCVVFIMAQREKKQLAEMAAIRNKAALTEVKLEKTPKPSNAVPTETTEDSTTRDSAFPTDSIRFTTGPSLEPFDPTETKGSHTGDATKKSQQPSDTQPKTPVALYEPIPHSVSVRSHGNIVHSDYLV